MRLRPLSDVGMKTDLDDLLNRLGYRPPPTREMARELRREAWRTNRPPAERREKPRCGARTRGARGGRPCQAQGIGAGGRCKFHGGMSTGPRTDEGRARALANLRQNAKHSKGAEDMPRIRIVRRADIGRANEQRQAATDQQLRREVRKEIVEGRPGEIRHVPEKFDNGAVVVFDPTRRKFVILDREGAPHGFRQDIEKARALARSLK